MPHPGRDGSRGVHAAVGGAGRALHGCVRAVVCGGVWLLQLHCGRTLHGCVWWCVVVCGCCCCIVATPLMGACGGV